jgi:predicted urease superfamily metal-dependent hydrolase
LEAHDGKRGGKPKVKTAFEKAGGAAFYTRVSTTWQYGLNMRKCYARQENREKRAAHMAIAAEE